MNSSKYLLKQGSLINQLNTIVYNRLNITSSTIIYVTDSTRLNKAIQKAEYTGNKGKTGNNRLGIIKETNAIYPLFFPNANTIIVPKKVQRILQRHIPKALLREIDDNINLAIEKCLVVISNLSSTVYNEESVEQWKALSSRVLHEQTKKGNDNTYVYTKILKVLKYSTSEFEPIIEIKKNEYGTDTYQSNVYSKCFKLTDTYKTDLISILYKITKLLNEEINSCMGSCTRHGRI